MLQLYRCPGDKKERREPGTTANLIGDSSVIYPVVVINMGGYKFKALLDSGASNSYASVKFDTSRS